ncbi:hypothetical protein ACVW07_002037 [Cellulomonas sp. URHB0016]
MSPHAGRRTAARDRREALEPARRAVHGHRGIPPPASSARARRRSRRQDRDRRRPALGPAGRRAAATLGADGRRSPARGTPARTSPSSPAGGSVDSAWHMLSAGERAKPRIDDSRSLRSVPDAGGVHGPSSSTELPGRNSSGRSRPRRAQRAAGPGHASRTRSGLAGRAPCTPSTSFERSTAPAGRPGLYQQPAKVFSYCPPLSISEPSMVCVERTREWVSAHATVALAVTQVPLPPYAFAFTVFTSSWIWL